MRPGAPARTVKVLVAYAVVAWALLPALGVLQRVLALPPLFGSLARVGAWLGAVLAAVVAWRYPDLGGGDGG